MTRPRSGQDPPKLADALLRWVLPHGKRGESILGDLREEFRGMTGGGKPGLPSLWYWQQALRLTLCYLTQPARTPALSIPRRSPMLHDLTSDLRSALRMFRHNPGTSSLIVMTLALAIGASTIGFAFADLALFRGLPVDDPSRVVSIFASDTHGSNPRARVSAPDYIDYRDRSQTLERVSSFRQGRAPLIKDGQSRTLSVTWATGDLFAAMGQPAVQGRPLVKDDDAPGADPVAVLSHRYWQEEFGGRPDAVGRTMQVGRDIFTIVGVITPEMEFGNLAEIDVWLPMVALPNTARENRNMRFVARLKPGVSFETAAAEIAAIGDSLAREYPEANGGWKARLVPIRDLTGGDGFWVVIALFLLSIGLLMAIAIANVSNLVLVRAVARQRELAVRTALGARRSRLVRQLVIEGLTLSVVSAAVAMPLAWAGLKLIASISPEPVFRQLAIDAHEILFVSGLTLICPLLFCVAPARSLSRTDTRQVLAVSGTRGATAGTKGRAVLVVAQVSLAVILLTASSLAVRSTNNSYALPTGMKTAQSLVFTLEFNDVQYETPAAAVAAARATQSSLASLPGVEAAAMVSSLPILGSEQLAALTIDGATRAAGETAPTAIVTLVSPEAGRALGLELLTGDWWNSNATAAAVVTRATAERFLGGVQNAVGRRIAVQLGSAPVSARVVGVSNDVLQGDFSRVHPARVWLSMDEVPRRLAFVLKTGPDPAQLGSQVRSVVATTAPAIPIEFMDTFDQALKHGQSSDYAVIGMLAVFAGLAVLLASAGLFGVVSYSAAQRTAEFGTRMALGASAWDVVRLVSGQSARLLAFGLSIGLAGGVAVGTTMGSVLDDGLSPADPVTLLLVSGLLIVITLVATAIPALRASRIDPVVALRTE